MVVQRAVRKLRTPECKAMSSCCLNGRSRKIGPGNEKYNDIIEIRPKRHLRIQHFNARPRDSALEEELQLYLKNHSNYGRFKYDIHHKKITARKTGKLVSQNDNNATNHPHMAKGQEERNVLSRPTSFNAHSSHNTDQFRPSHSRSSEGGETIMSSSNVEVSLNPQGNEDGFMSEIEEKDELSIATSRSLKSAVSEPLRNKEFGTIKNNAAKDPGVVLFFIHGVGGSSDIWKPQLDYFANLGYEIVSPDLIGHGLSFAPHNKKSYHFREILRDVEAMFDFYCKRTNIIIGHSYGCAFATVLARQRAKLVSKLILVSGGGPVPLAPQPGIFSLPLCMLTCVKPCTLYYFTRGAFYKNSKVSVDKEKAFDIPSYVLDYTMNGQWWLDGDDLYHSCISMPTLLIWGRHDKFVSLEEEEAMDKVIVNSKLEIVEETGHMVMMEAPDHFNNIVHQFITQGIIKPSSINQKEDMSNIDLGGASNSLDRDKNSRSGSPWFSPRKKRPDSSKSNKSVSSVKSSKSRMSMRKGVLTHSML